jgi:hypothetical protein
MIFPFSLTLNPRVPAEIVIQIREFLAEDDVFHFSKRFLKVLIEALQRPRTMRGDCIAMVSYYDDIRKSQLSRKHGFHMLWKRVRIHEKRDVHQYETKIFEMNRENYVNYHIAIYDNAFIDIQGLSYTERTVRLKINLHSSLHYQVDTYKQILQFIEDSECKFRNELSVDVYDNYIWIWWRQNIYFELCENYSDIYNQFRRINILKRMDGFCAELHHFLVQFFSHPFFPYLNVSTSF